MPDALQAVRAWGTHWNGPRDHSAFDNGERGDLLGLEPSGRRILGSSAGHRRQWARRPRRVVQQPSRLLAPKSWVLGSVDVRVVWISEDLSCYKGGVHGPREATEHRSMQERFGDLFVAQANIECGTDVDFQLWLAAAERR